MIEQVNGGRSGSCSSDSNHSGENGDLHVVTENGEQCFMWRASQLTYIAQGREELPQILATKFGPSATKLDLSYNTLTSFKNINLFTNLSELILDNNLLEDDQLDFRQNLRLKTLSLNKNKLSDLYKLISSVRICFPNLEFLSLIGNPLCPAPISASSSGVKQQQVGDFMFRYVYDGQVEYDTQNYRHFIIYHLPNLRFLDSSPVSSHERDLALRRCYWMKPLENNNGQQPQARVEQATMATPTTVTAYGGLSGSTKPPQTSQACEAAPEGFQMTIMSDYSSASNLEPERSRHNSQDSSDWQPRGQLLNKCCGLLRGSCSNLKPTTMVLRVSRTSTIELTSG